MATSGASDDWTSLAIRGFSPSVLSLRDRVDQIDPKLYFMFEGISSEDDSIVMHVKVPKASAPALVAKRFYSVAPDFLQVSAAEELPGAVMGRLFSNIFKRGSDLAAARRRINDFLREIKEDPIVKTVLRCSAVEAAVVDAEAKFCESLVFLDELQRHFDEMQLSASNNDMDTRDRLRHHLVTYSDAITRQLKEVQTQVTELGGTLSKYQGFSNTDVDTPSSVEQGNELYRELIKAADEFAVTEGQHIDAACKQHYDACLQITVHFQAVTVGIGLPSLEKKCLADTTHLLLEADNNSRLVMNALRGTLGINSFWTNKFHAWPPMAKFIAQAETFQKGVVEQLNVVSETAAKLTPRVAKLLAALEAEVHRPLTFAATSDEALRIANYLKELVDANRDAMEEANECAARLARQERKGCATDDDRAKAAEAQAARAHCQAELAAAFKQYYQPLMQHFSETRDILNAAFPAGDPASHRGDVSLADFDATSGRTFSDRISLMTERSTGAQVMLKRFRMDQVSQFRKECDSLRRVKHPFVAELKYTFFNRDDESHYIVMPYYGGGTLDEWARLNADDAEALLRIFMQVAEGLSVLHANGVTHCDVKPGNVVLTSKLPSATPRIIDFDFAKTTDADFLSTATRTVALGATAGFAAPEIIDFLLGGVGPKNPDEVVAMLRSPLIDSYAFGRTLACIIDPSQDCARAGKWEWPEDADNNRVALALDPYCYSLETVVQDLLKPRSLRLPMSEALPALNRIWQIAHQPLSAAADAAGRPVACCICMGDFANRDTIACASAPNATHPAHVYCKDCFNTNVTSWGALPPSDHVASKGRLFCTHPVGAGLCTGTFDTGAALSMLTPEHLETVQRVFGQVREMETLASVKRQMQQSETERAVTHIRETLLGFRCPSCKTPSFIDFHHCLSLTCTMCRTVFCGYCQEIFQGDGHEHIFNRHAGLGLFTTEAKWRAFWEPRQRAAIEGFMQTLPSDISSVIRVRNPDIFASDASASSSPPRRPVAA